ncbi:MAG: hypothetical protein ABI026_04335, partial [Gemmatimonadaceae bacterium]
LTLAMRRRPGGWIAGLHPYDDPGRVFALADCLITDRRVVTTWHEIMAAAEYFPAESSLRGSVRWSPDGPSFVLMGARRWTEHARFFEAVPALSALYWEPEDSARQLLGDRRQVLKPSASFSQVNPVVADALRDYVAEQVMAFEPCRVTDAYSGSADLGALLAAKGVTVTAIELDPDAARWAEQRLPPPSRSIAGRVEDVLPRLPQSDVVVLNPPRSGVHVDVTAYLEADDHARAVVYVSCDPATLARDVARLTSYEIRSVLAFDMFPQTAHVETVCVLTSRSRTGLERE